MKKAAAAARSLGLGTEEILCSSDPKSLDALIVPWLSLCLADGTSPHTLEPQFPGAVENIINLGRFWNREKLFERADEIRSASIENSIYYRRLTKYLSAAGTLGDDTARLLEPGVDREKTESFAVRFCARETPRKKNCPPGKKLRRYLSAVTPEGKIFLDETVSSLASRVIGIADEYSAVSGILTERIGETAAKNGYDVIFCLCPMKQKVCEHIIIPEASLAVLTIKNEHESSILPDRLIHARRFVDSSFIREHKNRLAFNKKLASQLTDEAVGFLKKAKEKHDELEKIYMQAMDYEALSSFSEKFIKEEIVDQAAQAPGIKEKFSTSRAKRVENF